MTRAPRRRRLAALAAGCGLVLAALALVPGATSSAWQDDVYARAELEVRSAVVAPDVLSAGSGFTCAVVEGAVWCWGANGQGQLGDGTTAAAGVPVATLDGAMTAGATTVNAGVAFTCAVSDARAYCWGAGGKLGNWDVNQPWEGAASLTPVAVYAEPAVAGNPNAYASPLAGQSVVGVVAGDVIACAWTAAGSAACWGRAVALAPPPGIDPSFTNGPRAVPTSADDPTSALPPGERIVSMSTEFENACFVTDAGSAYCWGRNQEGELGNGSQGTLVPVPTRVSQGAMSGGPVTQTTSGTFHACALESGAAYCWGLRAGGLIGDGGGETGSALVPSAVVGTSGTLVSISAFGASTCALGSTGQAWCWGSNSNGQLGTTAVPVGQFSGVAVPVELPPGVTFTSLSTGVAHVCATGDDDNVYCWGSLGTLGTGAGQSQTPVPVDPVVQTWAGA